MIHVIFSVITVTNDFKVKQKYAKMLFGIYFVCIILISIITLC